MGLGGSKLQYDYYFPNGQTQVPTTGSTTDSKSFDIAGNGAMTTVSDLTVGGVNLYTLSITDYAIFFNFTNSAIWTSRYTQGGNSSTSVTFNGLTLTDTTDSVSPIAKVKLKTNIAGLTDSDITVSNDHDSFKMDLTGIRVTKLSYISLTFTFMNPIQGTSASNFLDGSKKDDMIRGFRGNDVLNGNGGNDTLDGGAGIDILTGGDGKDTFLFRSVSDLGTTESRTDTITDLTSSDKIDFSKIDAITTKSGDQAFTFIGTQAFSKTAGELRYEKQAGDTYVYGDVNGDGKSDFVLHIDKAIDLNKGYFIL